MEEVLKSEVKMPWQNKALIILNVLMIFGLILFVYFFQNIYTNDVLKEIKSSNVYNIDYSEEDIQKMLKTSILILNVVFVFLIIFVLILTLGFYKGWKWALITNLIFDVFGLIIIFLDILTDVSMETLDSSSLEFSLFNIFIGILELYFSIYCLKHPFYNQKKIS